MKTGERTLRRIDQSQVAWEPAQVTAPVAEIIEDVRRRGDQAVAEYARRFGDPAPRAVTQRELDEALESIDAALAGALRFAANSIERFARAQKDSLSAFEIEANGLAMGQSIVPIDRAGAYVPGGRYPLPSSALMTVVTARVAGVREVIVCTPNPTPETLAASAVAGADRVFVVGGAQAIAAMAFGTAMIPRVDKIVGPGNAYVTEAKRCVFGHCGIDLLAGPSEVMIVASRGAQAHLVAADLLAQAEHDMAARVLLITDDLPLLGEVEEELVRQLATLPTAGVASQSLQRGGAVLVGSIDEAVSIANRLAPEHLELHGAAAEGLASLMRHYGSLFIGSHAAEALGDYASGPNHVLPTGGAARYTGGLSVFQFLCIRTYQRAKAPVSRDLIDAVDRLAAAESLEAHRRAAQLRG